MESNGFRVLLLTGSGRKYFTSDACNIRAAKAVPGHHDPSTRLVHAPTQPTDGFAPKIYVPYRLGKREETAVRDHLPASPSIRKLLPLSSLLLARTLTIHLQQRHCGGGGGRERVGRMAVIPRRIRGGFIRGTVFASSRDPLCSNEPRRFTRGRAAEIASLLFFSFFSFQMTTFHVNYRILHSCGTSIEYFRIPRSERREIWILFFFTLR